MKLRFVSVILADQTLDEVLDFAAAVVVRKLDYRN